MKSRSKRRIKLSTKIMLTGLFHSILQMALIFSFAWFNDCILEMLIIYICFFYFRTKFEKQYHALTSWGCTFITMIVYYCVSTITPDKSVSLLLVMLLTYFINYCSFIYRDYLDAKALRDEINKDKTTTNNNDDDMKKNNKKKKYNTNRNLIIEILGSDNLDEESIESYCVAKGIPYISETIYLFLNNTLKDTADILDVDASTITRRIKKFIEIGLKD